jgi:MFS family permease
VLAQVRRSAAAFAAAFTNRNLRRLLLAFAGSAIGQWAAGIAVTVYSFEQAGAGGVALQIVLALGPAAIAAPFASTLGDRFPRVRVMVVSDLLRAAIVAGSALLVLAGAPLIAVLLASSLKNVAGAAFEPAKSALLPELATEPDELTATNVTSSTIDSVSIFIGPALGGVLVAATSVEVVLLVCAGTFVWSAVLVAGIRHVPSHAPADGAGGGMLRQAADGARAVASSSALRLVVGLMAAQTFLDGMLGVLLAVVALDLLQVGESGLGWLNGAVGIGGLLGAALAAGLVGRRLSGSLGVGCLLWGLPLALLGVAPEVFVAIVAMGLVGVGNTLVDVSGFTLLQRVAPEDVVARVFGVLESLILASVALGAALTPLLVRVAGIETALVVAGLFLPVITAASWRTLRRIDAAAPRAAEELALLRGVPLFAPLGAFELERLAQALEPVTAAAGEDVMRQGEAGDRFYVIESGRVEVLVDGRPVREQGAGEAFGEIALLRDVPRTATVRALEPSRLRAMPRAAFLAAVAGSPPSAAAAESVVAARLAWARPAAARAG